MAQINKPNTYFNPILYTGTGSATSITGVGFQPDLVWIKRRNNVSTHRLVDIVRGATNYLSTSTTDAEGSTGNVSSFDSDGFSHSAGGTAYNGSGDTYVAWNWLAGGTAVSNTNGNITSSVSANTTSGFSVVSWTGNSGTVGHGLGVKPACIIVKSRQSVNNWVVMHQGLTGGMSTNVLVLNSTAAQGSGGAGMAEPTVNVFTITSGLAANDNNIGYVFAEKKGFSKFGSYTGTNTNDGPFVYTGFKPAFLLIKPSNGAYNWTIIDTKRNPYNVTTLGLIPNTTSADTTGAGSTYNMDILSNGFKLRYSSNELNGALDYIYMAFAENPLVGTNNIPATAR